MSFEKRKLTFENVYIHCVAVNSMCIVLLKSIIGLNCTGQFFIDI